MMGALGNRVQVLATLDTDAQLRRHQPDAGVPKPDHKPSRHHPTDRAEFTTQLNSPGVRDGEVMNEEMPVNAHSVFTPRIEYA